MPLVEGTATAVLTGESHGNAIEQERAEGQRRRHAVIERQFSCAHLFPLLQQLFYLWVDGRPRYARDGGSQSDQSPRHWRSGSDTPPPSWPRAALPLGLRRSHAGSVSAAAWPGRTKNATCEALWDWW